MSEAEEGSIAALPVSQRGGKTLSNIKMYIGYILDIPFAAFNHYLDSFLFYQLGIVIQIDYLKWIYGIAFMIAIAFEILRKRYFEIPISYHRKLLTLYASPFERY